jgi:MFS family permease
MSTVASLPFFLFTLPAGALADKVDRQKLICLINVGLAATAVGLAALGWLHLLNPYVILVSVFCVGIGFAFNAPAWTSIVPQVVSDVELPSAATLSGLQFNISGIIGPALGGLLIPLAGANFVFALNATCFFFVVLAVRQWKQAPMQAALYLTVTRGFAAPEARMCYERVESLCHSLNRPLLLYSALTSQWRYSLWTDKLKATMQIAERVYSLAQEQNDARLMMGAYRVLASTLYFLGDFETARQYAMRGLEIWRSGGVQCQAEEVSAPAVNCLCINALTEWHFGETASCKATMAEAIPLARELNDMPALAVALYFAWHLAHFEGNRAEVERLASELIELSTRQI